MKYLLLLSNHLNQEYIKSIDVDKVILVVANEQFRHVRYHQFRIIYHLSAATHFAKQEELILLRNETFVDIFKEFSKEDKFIIYEPNDVWFRELLVSSFEECHLSVEFIPDINFYFEDIVSELGNPPYKLDPLYKKWRKVLNILMDGSQPIGGKYSYDQENRGTPPKELNIEPPLSFDSDQITKDIAKEVSENFSDHPKSLKPFLYPVTSKDASKLLEHFIEFRLPYYGKYQDAMMEQHPFMVHSLLSTSINLGLLMAKDVVKLVEKSYLNGEAPIEATEGFIRQVLGWREYIRGIYLKEMNEGYQNKNTLNHTLEKPRFLYDGDIDLHCLNVTIQETINYGYNHHIERLMIIGNITNLMGIDPIDIREWFNEMYVDSFDWVVTPNVIGMAQYADGGLMSTKPYIASANYINKMSDYCKACKYDPKLKTGEKACPVNALYYYFLDRHEQSLSKNPRMKFMYSNYRKLDNDIYEELMDSAKKVLKQKYMDSYPKQKSDKDE